MINETILALIPICAPDVAPNTIAQIIRVESEGNLLAINVNGLGKVVRASSQKEAAELTRHYIGKGYSVDVGLMQINSSNFASLGYSSERIEELFEPCANITAGSQILKDFYTKSKAAHNDSALALRGAISAYNTGSFTNGVKNGYVEKVYGGKAEATSITDTQLAQALHAPTAINVDLVAMQKELKQQE